MCSRHFELFVVSMLRFVDRALGKTLLAFVRFFLSLWLKCSRLPVEVDQRRAHWCGSTLFFDQRMK